MYVSSRQGQCLTYDAVSNVLSVVNGASVPQSGKAGGQMAHTYTYDALYRLVSATGTYTGADNKTASYTLAMGYDNMHRITSKHQILTQNNVQFDGTLNAGYDLTYTYGTDTGKKFQLANVKDVNYRTEETPSESENVNNRYNARRWGYVKGYWRLAGMPIMHMAASNVNLRKAGYTFLYDEYVKWLP